MGGDLNQRETGPVKTGTVVRSALTCVKNTANYGF
jgi:hypothetical protein